MHSISSILRKFDGDHILFGSLGFFDANSLRIQIELQRGDPSNVWNHVAAMAALLHERVHWLQYVSTTSGLFRAFIIEWQTALTWQHAVTSGQVLSRSDVPLFENSAAPNNRWRELWHSLESLQRYHIGGCQAEQLRELSGPPTRRLGIFSDLCRMAARRLSGDSGVAADDDLWEPKLTSGTWRVVLDREDRVFGANHLMEAAARTNEYYKWDTEIQVREPEYELPPDSFYTGIYGEARSTFDDILKLDPGLAKDVLLLTLIDYALNAPLPPIVPPGVMRLSPDEYSPGSRFIALCVEAKRRVRIPTRLNVDQVRDFIADIYRALINFMIPPYALLSTLPVTFPSAASIRLPEDLYGLTADNRVIPGPNGRFPFFLRRAIDALAVRRDHPEFIIFPALTYIQDRKTFHELFDPIGPPLYGNSPAKLRILKDTAGWLEYSIASAFQQDAMRWALYCDHQTLAKRFRQYQPLFSDGSTIDEGQLFLETLQTLYGEGDLTQWLIAQVFERESRLTNE